MPEAYTHILIGTNAAEMAEIRPQYPAVFALGCQGADLLFCYQVWKKGSKRRPNLPALGGRMHKEKTGAFLMALAQNASTPMQQEYVAGFLCHYAADCTLHPYVNYLTQKGQLYGKKGGHGYFEVALDSYLCQQQTGDGAVKADKNCPALNGEELAQVSHLLWQTVEQVFGGYPDQQPFADSYHHTRMLRKIFISRFGIKRAIFWIAERVAFGGAGFITGHVTPAKLKQPLPSQWVHPATEQQMEASLEQLLQQAKEKAKSLLQGYFQWKKGEISHQQFTDLIGNYSYEDGGTCQQEEGQQP